MLEGFETLNPEQREAVIYKHDGALQVVAGPGTGKTRVMAYRVAHLIKNCEVRPENLVIVTYTRKAAEEMKTRLEQLLGPEVASEIEMLGTFHSVASKHLRKHGRAIGIEPSFNVVDEKETLEIVTELVKEHFSDRKRPPSVAQLVKNIEFSKRWGYRTLDEESSTPGVKILWLYRDELRRRKAFDFQDLLIHFRRLLLAKPRMANEIRHVVVDEFQDTTALMYGIIKGMTKQHMALTIIGDPNQSIYGFAGAEPDTFEVMLIDYPHARRCFLRENYRSSGNILEVAATLLEQDAERIPTNLTVTHVDGPPVTLKALKTPREEAVFIAKEIKRLMQDFEPLSSYKSFAILIPIHAVSRNIEFALRNEGIPYKMAGKYPPFFQLDEIKDIVAYLQLLNGTLGEAGTRAFERVARIHGFDQDIVDAIDELVQKEGLTRLQAAAKIPNLSAEQLQDFEAFIATLSELTNHFTTNSNISSTIEAILALPDFQFNLETVYGLAADLKLARANTQEFRAFAEEVESQHLEPQLRRDGTVPKSFLQSLLEVTQEELDFASTIAASPTKPQVTIASMHAAKGLEWPVTFIPAAEIGIQPLFTYSEDTAMAKSEGRRLLYVGITRSQAMLYLTHSKSGRPFRGKLRKWDEGVSTLSYYLQPFLAGSKAASISEEPVAFSKETEDSLRSILNCPAGPTTSSRPSGLRVRRETPQWQLGIPPSLPFRRAPTAHLRSMHTARYFTPFVAQRFVRRLAYLA